MKNNRPIPYSYWVTPGRFLAGEYPGSQYTMDPRRTVRSLIDEALAVVFFGSSGRKKARTKIRALLEADLTSFIDLTELGELSPYEDILHEEGARLGRPVEYRRMPFRDHTAPTGEHMVLILDSIDAALESGHVVYVHCMRGLGRTGTVVGCHLVRHGMSGKQALREIHRLRKGTLNSWWPSPETDEQREMVLGWAGGDTLTST